MKEIIKIVYLTIPFILIIGTVISIIKFSRLKPFLKVLSYYLWFCLISDLLNRYLGEIKENNLILIPIFGLLEYLFFYWIYTRFMIKGSKLWISIFSIIIILFMIYDIANVIRLPVDQFQSYGRVADSLGILLFSLIYFSQSLKENHFPWDYQLFNGTVLFYAGISLLVFLPINFLIQASSTNDPRLLIFTIHFGITAVLYTVIILVIWKNGKTQIF